MESKIREDTGNSQRVDVEEALRHCDLRHALALMSEKL